MFTRCPKCKTVHLLTAAALSHSRGLVQCGQCGRTFSSLSFLFDDWPSGQAYAPAKGPNNGPPVIGKTEKPTTDEDLDTTDDQDLYQQTNKSHGLAWALVFVLVSAITIANAAWTFREPLLKDLRVHSWLDEHGWLEIEEEGLLKDPGQIQLISRDMHTHPTRTGILVLSLTFVNLAQRTQIFPVLEITLLDATNQPIAHRRFKPREYLRSGAEIESGLAKDVFLPVLLELGDPGDQAVGFEIEFL